MKLALPISCLAHTTGRQTRRSPPGWPKRHGAASEIQYATGEPSGSRLRWLLPRCDPLGALTLLVTKPLRGRLLRGSFPRQFTSTVESGVAWTHQELWSARRGARGLRACFVTSWRVRLRGRAGPGRSVRTDRVYAASRERRFRHGDRMRAQGFWTLRVVGQPNPPRMAAGMLPAGATSGLPFDLRRGYGGSEPGLGRNGLKFGV